MWRTAVRVQASVAPLRRASEETDVDARDTSRAVADTYGHEATARVRGRVRATPPPQAPPLAAVRSTDLPALFASLFGAGRQWTQPARAELRWNDGSGVERATSNGTVTCWVDSARAVRGGRVARIACHTAVRDRSVLELDATGEPTDSPAGLYVGTATGLWQVEPS